MTLIILLLSFILGTIVGSFLNVVSLRYGTGFGFGGRSFCFTCNKKLNWYELIPILSFIVQKGKCRGCKSQFSAQYPTVELLTGLVFSILITLFSLLPFEVMVVLLPFYLFIFSLLIVIAVYDMRHMIIPDFLAFLFGFCSLMFLFFTTPLKELVSFPGYLDLFSGFILAAPFAILWAVSRGTWMGLGDAKLSIGIGWLLGFVHGVSALALSVWMGAIWSVGKILIERVKGKHHTKLGSEIPFAPFLILATFIQFLFGFDFFGLQTILDLFI